MRTEKKEKNAEPQSTQRFAGKKGSPLEKQLAAMSKDWRIIFRFAVMGLAFTAFFVAYQVLTDSSPPPPPNWPLLAVFVLICPASLLFAPLFAWFFEAAEVGTALFYVLWLLVGLANAAIYALIGAAYVGLSKTQGGTSAN